MGRAGDVRLRNIASPVRNGVLVQRADMRQSGVIRPAGGGGHHTTVTWAFTNMDLVFWLIQLLCSLTEKNC